MAEKRVSVRLVATGGRQVRAELEGVGEAGARGFGRLSREMDLANARVAAFARRATLAAAAATAALAAAGAAMIRSGLQTVDAQAKLAQSLGHDRRLDPDAGARGRVGGRVDVRDRTGDQGSDATAEPGGHRDWARCRCVGPARACRPPT